MKSSMSIKSKVSGFPRRVSFESYQRALAVYANRIKGIPGVTSLHTMGSVGSPGLSDIDVIVVVSNFFESKNSKLLSPAGIDDYLFLHGPIVIPERMVTDLQWIIYATNPVAIFGSVDLPLFADLGPEICPILTAAYLVDFCESRMLQYCTLHSAQVVNMRPWLTRTWSCLHSINLVKRLLKAKIPTELEYHVEQVKKPRLAWQANNEISVNEFLLSLFSAEFINSWCFRQGLSFLYGDAVVKKYDSIRLPGKNINFAGEEVSYSLVTREIFGHTLTRYNIIQDCRYWAHLSCYLGATDDESLVIAKRARKALRMRFDKVEAHRRWLKKHAKNAGSMPGYIGIPKSYSIKQSIKHALSSLFFLVP